MQEPAERRRLTEAREQGIPWKKWGPYLSERQWGTVREDYSQDGSAWDYFPHEQARSRAYRWGEDGIAGICDDHQRICFALALWNGADPNLKERLFGVTNGQGNHGEDVKEYYFYLDSTPTHSYMKYLYKYPQAAFPYENLIAGNRSRTRKDPEYELLDTGVFNQNRYFDVFVEYAKDGPEDIFIRITAHNRGDLEATLHLLPTLWCRNTWSWREGGERPVLRRLSETAKQSVVLASDPKTGERYLYCEGPVSSLFTENDTNRSLLWGQWGEKNVGPYVKDGINEAVVHGKSDAVNPQATGTKVAAHYVRHIEPGACAVVRLRLSLTGKVLDTFGPEFDRVFAARTREADEFYEPILSALDSDRRAVARQAFAGMLWTKQYYHFDVDHWLDEHGINVLSHEHTALRNASWFHMVSDDIISMPDKWEYPWFAAWDLAFHALAFAALDLDFAKSQIDLLLRERYIHPSGQLPAYEWNFSDVNPPVHAFAAKFIYDLDRTTRGTGDVTFLKRVFHKLLLNFTWWVNRKDREGKNVFEGGFLGLDNISVFDRSAPLPLGGSLEQADGTAWVAFFCLSMLEIAMELSTHDRAYEDMALKFVEHFVWIGSAMMRGSGAQGSMWDDEDAFFYDVLRLPDGRAGRLKVRSLVGLLPICATIVFTPKMVACVPQAADNVRKRFARLPELVDLLPNINKPGVNGNVILTLVDERKLRRVLTKVLDETEFFSPHGIRSLSKYHEAHPYTIEPEGERLEVKYLPGESDSGMFGGNSNWRGPVWMPMNAMIYRALMQFYRYYGDSFTIECPTGSGKVMTLFEVAEELNRRLSSIFLPDARGHRPVYGDVTKFQQDPHWRDYVLFYEYFHGDTGAGLGASHQTGWTGLAAFFAQAQSRVTAQQWLDVGRESIVSTP